jgi:translation initiation factor 2-alpha kinase 3
MSMFRKPGEESSSSSSSESSYEESDNDQDEKLRQSNILSRINTLDSTSSGRQETPNRPSLAELRQSSTQDVRDLLLHALLEKDAISEAAARLGKDRSDPEVQKLGRETYREMARQISNTVDDKYASDDMRGHRSTAQDGINRLTRGHLTRLSAIPEGSHALVARPANGLPVEIPLQPTPGLAILSGLPTPVELHLHGYPDMQADRYAREFAELEIVGKGGYGKVYKVKHKLDGSFYAVKRITVSSAKLAKIQQHGPQEMESMLEEVRSLARFDHANIVRYHNAWLELTTIQTDTSPTAIPAFVRPGRLLEDASTQSSDMSDVSGLRSNFATLEFSGSGFGDGADIVFEDSHGHDTSRDVMASQDETDRHSTRGLARMTRRQMRRDSQASQATIATISSTRSRMSAVEDVDEGGEDDDIENIPRSHVPFSQDSTSDVTGSMVTHSDAAGHFAPARMAGPVLTLNVQMSLYESNLAAFLSQTSTPAGAASDAQHCFHGCVSLELLGNIVSGVEYLHAQGVVHRDLKPANIFLSLTTARHAPYGSIDVAGCKQCPVRECLHVVPRIGDFGLVAALGNGCVEASGTTKPVGTEFYRPETSSGVNEKLDVFALGVIGLEMMRKFDTRMERVEALSRLRRGEFPDGFAWSLGLGETGDEIQRLIGDMVLKEEKQRLGCEQVKKEIAKLVHILRA